MAEEMDKSAVKGADDIGASKSNNQPTCKKMKSSISKHSPSNSKRHSTTQKPHNPRKGRHTNCTNKVAAEHDQGITNSSIDCNPTTLRVCAFQSKFPDHISGEHLRQHFSKYKTYILDATILRNENGRYGVITFSSNEIAENARKAFRGQRLLGCLTQLKHYNLPHSNYKCVATTEDTVQSPSKVTSFVPSMTDSHTAASFCVARQSSMRNVHETSREEFVASSRKPPKSTLLVEGIHSKLPDSISDEELMKHFSAFDEHIVSASIVRDPLTKLSTGCGIVVFSCSETAMKAKRKYNGTHLCRKYQLRLTISFDSSTPSTSIVSTKSHEGVGVSSTTSDNSLELCPSQNSAVVESFPAHSKKIESQRSETGIGNNESEVLVPDSVDTIPFKTRETFSSAGTLVIENLSSFINEDELKALISNCGAETSSCTIVRSPIAHSTCTANISLVDGSQVEKVIAQLNEKEILKCKLRVHSIKKRDGEPHLHVKERKISIQLFQFISKHSHAQIELFMQKGGAFYYQELKSSAILSCPSEGVLIDFLLQVFNGYTEKSIVFNQTKWLQLILVRDEHTPSLLTRTESKSSAQTDVHIIPRIDKHEILFVGTCEGVAMISSWLTKKLDQEIEVESDKMEALITIYPTLASELSDRYDIKVLNYSQHSTVIELDGDVESVQNARQEIEVLISKFGVAEVLFEQPPVLLDSARKRIKENELKVSIISKVARSSKEVCLIVSSFCPKQLEKATAILKGHPTYKSLKIPGDFTIDLAKLKKVQAEISKEFQVLIRRIYKQKTCTTLLISSFVKTDVSASHKKLQEQLFGESITLSGGHVKQTTTAQDVKESSNLSSKLYVSSSHNPNKTSAEHCIRIRRQFHLESCCRAFVTLSTEITYYMQNRADWFNEVTKFCMSVNVPKKVHLASAKSGSSNHVYIFEGKICVVDKVIQEIQSLAQIFCVKVVRLSLPTENVRLMQSRWKQFKEDNEARFNVCIDFTLTSPTSSPSVSIEQVSTVTFTLCGSDVKQITEVVQQLQSKESGLNLPDQKTVHTVDQLMIIKSLIIKEQLNFDKYAVLIRVIPDSQTLYLKAVSRQILDQAYRDILTLLESSVPSHTESAVSPECWNSELSQSIASRQPINICTLLFEPRYIPLSLSQKFVKMTSQFEKGHGVRVISISDRLINSTVKQVIFKSSCGQLITVQLCYCNLLYEKVDAIVNCSRTLASDAKAIGGEVLQLELDNYIAHHGVEEGTNICACLDSGNLPSNKIIHIIPFSQDENGSKTSSIVQKALECAQKHNLTQISFPSVSMDVASAENFVYNLQRFFIQNPSSCVCTVRIVCSSERFIHAYSGVKEFDGKNAIMDLPKLEGLKPPLFTSVQHTDCQWYWQGDDGTFIPYSKDINKTLSFEYKLCPTGTCSFQVGFNSYIANFERKEQRNITTHFVRKMKIGHINVVNESGLRISVKWLHHDEGKEASLYSATDSALIEKMYFSSNKPFMLALNSTRFLFDFKSMQKVALQRPQPSKNIHIQRKVVLHQLANIHSHFSPKWYYMDDTKQFSLYSNHDSASIESMYQNQAISTLSIHSKEYTFDFNDMKQINVVTGYKRSIKRVPKSSVDVPSDQDHCVPLHHTCRGIVISLVGPSISQKVIDEFKDKMESMIYISELPLPLCITNSVASEARVLHVAKKYNIECRIILKATDAESKILKLSGAESVTQNAMKEVMEEIMSYRQSSSTTAVDVPAEWQPQTKNMQLFELSKSNSEYLRINPYFIPQCPAHQQPL